MIELPETSVNLRKHFVNILGKIIVQAIDRQVK